ncbi:hypothetical protein CEXT_511471 [Caerostris extrusa]|uniref:Uncharacterized protein n=1 Tax=Caerostris extrusa TaxID=172846 RepID=A0AAV4SKS4_CAEEX|nr:hypothetical protein CEXT_511471 [Caerostris extrusa]
MKLKEVWYLSQSRQRLTQAAKARELRAPIYSSRLRLTETELWTTAEIRPVCFHCGLQQGKEAIFKIIDYADIMTTKLTMKISNYHTLISDSLEVNP